MQRLAWLIQFCMTCNLTWWSTLKQTVLGYFTAWPLVQFQVFYWRKLGWGLLNNVTGAYPGMFRCHIVQTLLGGLNLSSRSMSKSAETSGERLSLWGQNTHAAVHPVTWDRTPICREGDVSQAMKLSSREDELSEPKRRLTVPHLFRVNHPEIPAARSI